ncbi:MAG: SCP2 sterol-binding domain-containing protein [Acidimicrobiales bacterium]|nr:SCP2 sterol-binding domain-containing protein [Acidimicrobiales bacterium]
MSDIDVSNLENLNDRAALKSLLEGRSDDEINQFVAALGVDKLFDMVIPAITQRLDADKAAGQSAVVQFDVKDAAGATHSFHITVENGTCTGAQGAASSPRLTLTFSMPSFLRFLAGLIDPMQAFMAGQLQVGGDMVFAMTFQTWFKLD